MIEKDDMEITEDDILQLYIVGYENKGESIILSIGNKFLGVIDCFKVGDKFKTKSIIKKMGIPIDFICWTHVDWDHTYGISELKEFFYEDTAIIIPEGLASKNIRNLFFDANSYQHKEYKKIFSIIDDTEDKNFISANENSEIYNFKFKYQDQDIDFVMKSFSPLSKIVKEQNESSIMNLVEDIKLDEDGKKTTGYEWYDNSNKYNNLFSIGLEISVKFSNDNIRLCLTGDLDNETIERMDSKKINRIFSRNTILKIPHHGSRNASELLDFKYNDGIEYQYAITTSFKGKNFTLPNEEVLEEYKKHGKVFRTDAKKNKSYGIVKYSCPIVKEVYNLKKSLHKEIQLFGDADEIN